MILANAEKIFFNITPSFEKFNRCIWQDNIVFKRVQL